MGLHALNGGRIDASASEEWNMDDPKKYPDAETSLNRRAFLVGLGKWSAIVVTTATVGLPVMTKAREGIQAAPDERVPGIGADENDIVEHRWCRVWGNAAGCRVWGNAGAAPCRVWGNAAGCRVWGNAAGCRVWGNGRFLR